MTTDLTVIAAALEAMRTGETTDPEELARQALACIPGEDAVIGPGGAGAQARIRDSLEAFRTAFQFALDDPQKLLVDPETARRRLAEARRALAQDGGALAVLEAVASGETPTRITLERSGVDRHLSPPAPILWRDDPDREYASDPVVSAGECAVLAGSGGGGKSWLCIRLAIEADRAREAGLPSAAACGLRVAARPIIMLSYEMSRKRVDMVAEAMGSPEGIYAFKDAMPIFCVDPQTRTYGPSPVWRETWDAIAAVSPALVVIDTGPKAMGGAEPNAAEPVIAFILAVERELQALAGAAALVLCHDTKAMRDAVRAGEDPGAGAVSGSGQWYDSPRGVLHLSRAGPGSDIRFVECLKASFGRESWGARLCPRYSDPVGAVPGQYVGLQLDPHGGRIAPGEMIEARRTAREAAARDGEVRPKANGDGAKARARGGTDDGFHILPE